MEKTNNFDLKIKDYDLNNPEKKKVYNESLFSEVSKSYDFATIMLSFGRDKSWKKKLIKNLNTHQHQKILDLACGTGDITTALINKFNGSEVFGLDLNEDMVKIARSKKIGAKFIIGDMNKTDFENEYFDIISGGYALRNSPDLQKALKEFHRIMKNGSVASFLDFSKSKNKLAQKVQYGLLKFWGNIWGLILHGNKEVYGYIADSLKLFPDRENLEKMIKDTGFKNVKTKVLFFGFTSIVSFSK